MSTMVSTDMNTMPAELLKKFNMVKNPKWLMRN